MSSIKVAWNRTKTASVVLAKIKEFTITPNDKETKFRAWGWYNQENHFSFGDDFDTLPQAQKFLDDIFAKM